MKLWQNALKQCTTSFEGFWKLKKTFHWALKLRLYWKIIQSSRSLLQKNKYLVKLERTIQGNKGKRRTIDKKFLKENVFPNHWIVPPKNGNVPQDLMLLHKVEGVDMDNFIDLKAKDVFLSTCPCREANSYTHEQINAPSSPRIKQESIVIPKNMVFLLLSIRRKANTQ